MRSWLVVPADSETKLAKVAQAGADAIVIDLAGSDPTEKTGREAARENAAGWLEANRPQSSGEHGAMHWVRISGLDTQHWREDLATAISGRPHGIMLADAASSAQVQTLAAEIWELEQSAGIEYSSTNIIPEIGSSPAAAMTLQAFMTEPHPRLLGFTWNAQILANRIGASRLQNHAGGWIDPLGYVRAQIVLLAKSLGLMAIDSAHAGFRDAEVLERVTTASRADGFTGMTAIHPLQVAPVNTAFQPDDHQIAEAREITALFEANPNSANVSYKGRTLEKSHLQLAKMLLVSE